MTTDLLIFLLGLFVTAVAAAAVWAVGQIEEEGSRPAGSRATGRRDGLP